MQPGSRVEPVQLPDCRVISKPYVRSRVGSDAGIPRMDKQSMGLKLGGVLIHALRLPVEKDGGVLDLPKHSNVGFAL